MQLEVTDPRVILPSLCGCLATSCAASMGVAKETPM